MVNKVSVSNWVRKTGSKEYIVMGKDHAGNQKNIEKGKTKGFENTETVTLWIIEGDEPASLDCPICLSLKDEKDFNINYSVKKDTHSNGGPRWQLNFPRQGGVGGEPTTVNVTVGDERPGKPN